MAEERKVRVKSSDNQVFEVEQAVAFQSHTIKGALDLAGIEVTVPLDEIQGSVLAKVFQYCKYHVDAQKSQYLSRDGVEKWEKEFLDVDQYTLIHLLRAADYLGINNLAELTFEGIAGLMRGKSIEEVGETVHIGNDFSPEEEALWIGISWASDEAKGRFG